MKSLLYRLWYWLIDGASPVTQPTYTPPYMVFDYKHDLVTYLHD